MLYIKATTTFIPSTGLYKAEITTPRRVISLFSSDRSTALTSALRSLGLPEHFTP